MHSLPTGVKVGPIVKKRGRPKGHLLTTIGLPSKKVKKANGRPISFAKMHTAKKEKGMCDPLLKWCLYIRVPSWVAMYVYTCTYDYYFFTYSHSFLVGGQRCHGTSYL